MILRNHIVSNTKKVKKKKKGGKLTVAVSKMSFLFWINRLSERKFKGQDKKDRINSYWAFLKENSKRMANTHHIVEKYQLPWHGILIILTWKFETNGRYTPHYFAEKWEIRNWIIGYFLMLLYVCKRSETLSRIIFYELKFRIKL